MWIFSKEKNRFFSDIDTRTCIYTHPYKRMSTQLTPKRRDWSPIDEVNNAIILEIWASMSSRGLEFRPVEKVPPQVILEIWASMSSRGLEFRPIEKVPPQIT